MPLPPRGISDVPESRSSNSGRTHFLLLPATQHLCCRGAVFVSRQDMQSTPLEMRVYVCHAAVFKLRVTELQKATDMRKFASSQVNVSDISS